MDTEQRLTRVENALVAFVRGQLSNDIQQLTNNPANAEFGRVVQEFVRDVQQERQASS